MLHPTPPGVNLRSFSLPAAFGLAVSMSGKADYDIASAMNWSPSTASRIFCPSDDYWPSLTSLPRLCGVLGNTVLLDWIAAQAQPQAMAPAPSPLNTTELLQGLEKILREVADVTRECGTAAADNAVDTAEARRILRELHHLIAQATPLMAGLHALREATRGQQ